MGRPASETFRFCLREHPSVPPFPPIDFFPLCLFFRADPGESRGCADVIRYGFLSPFPSCFRPRSLVGFLQPDSACHWLYLPSQNCCTLVHLKFDADPKRHSNGLLKPHLIRRWLHGGARPSLRLCRPGAPSFRAPLVSWLPRCFLGTGWSFWAPALLSGCA